MNIGIDIDNTLTEIQEELNNAAYNYAIKLGKDIKDNSNSSEDAKNNGDSYKKKFQFTYEELKYFLKDIQEEITNNALPRKYVVEIIKRLRTEGHKIYIITARDSEFHDNPYLLSKNWLDKNNIEYDKLIVNARDKAPVCVEENIDIFIDDQLNNCLNVAKKGIQTIRISDDNKEYENITTLCDWKQIYEYIHNEKVIKIIGCDELYKEKDRMKYVGSKDEKIEYRLRPGAYAIIVRKEDNKIGIVTDGEDYFYLGGGIEQGETKLEALKRELIEEAGYLIKNIKEFETVGQYLYAETKGYIKVIANVYIAEFDEKIAEPIEKDHTVLWVKPEDYIGKMCREWQEYILKEYMKKTKEIMEEEENEQL